MFLKTAFGLLLLCSAIPMLATNAYVVTGTNELGNVNLSTGVATTLGTTEVGSTVEALSGLGEEGGLLYGAGGANADTLYQINTSNGALTSIGASATIEYTTFGSTLTTLYGISTTGSLYSVNPSNGATTLIGSTGVPNGGNVSLSTGSGTLYFADYNSGYQLYTLSLTTGAATLVGSTATPLGALMWNGVSVLYGGADSPGGPYDVDTVSTSNGAVTTGPALSGVTGEFDGLAPIITASAPEPATWGLLGAGIAIIVIGRVWRGSSIKS